MSHKNDKIQKCIDDFQILTSVKEITLVTLMLSARTQEDRTFVLVTPDILKMDAAA